MNGGRKISLYSSPAHVVLCIAAAAGALCYPNTAAGSHSLGRRIVFEDPVAGTTIRYYYDGHSVIEERDGSDARVRYCVNGAQYIDERVATYDEGRAGFTYYLPGDDYSITATGNADGSVIERLDYSSTGDFAGGGPGASSFYHDADADLDLDLRDFANLQTCFDPSGSGASPECLSIHDFDTSDTSDGDIDLDDYARFIECFHGPFVTPDQTCGMPQRSRALPPSGTFTLHGRPLDVLSDGHTLLYVRARYYDPKHGRWLQRDPTGYADGGNLYESFRGNAARHRDPMGNATIHDPEQFVQSYLSDETALKYWILRSERGISLTVEQNPSIVERRRASHYEFIAGKGLWDPGTRTSYIVTEQPGVLQMGKASIGFSLADTREAVAARVSQSIHAHWDAFMGAPHDHGTTYDIIDLVLPLDEFESVAAYGRIGEYGLAAGYAGLGVVKTGAELYGAYWLAKGARRVFVRCVARDVEEVLVTRVSGGGGQRGLVEYSAGPIAPGGEAASVAAMSIPKKTYSISTANMTAAERQATIEYARRTNAWLRKHGSVKVQGTKGTLRSQANAAGRRERLRAARAGTPYRGQAGHVPDTALTGQPNPPGGWLDMPGTSNSVVGGGLGSRVGQNLELITVDGVVP